MGGRFYQDELRSSLTPAPHATVPPPSPPPPQGTARSASTPPPRRGDPAAIPGRGKATVLHLLVPLGGPVGLALSIVVGAVRGRDPRPLVAATEAAILRFAVQLVVLAGLGILLVLAGHEDWAVGPFALMATAYLFLPVVAAAWTWRTGRVFRYPLWDLVRPHGR
ncbi:hypothetical protein [Oryzobacter terrae]|uniref:hypothetical protein n=1 Tax=Oryzobacter terrae TaxID=1620385 RepID=UPI003670F9B1